MSPRASLLAAALLFVAGCETTPPLAPDDQGGESVAPNPFRLPGGRRASPAAPSPAGPDLRAEDEAKIASLKEAVASMLFAALSRPGIDGDALAASRAVLTAEPIDLGDPAGSYRCRTIRHGGPVPFVAYGHFACEVRAGRGGLSFVKSTGSERMAGRLLAAPGLGAGGERALLYVGTAHGADETPAPYPAAERSDVGLFERTGEARYRLTLPRRGANGLLDVIDLERVAD